MVFNVHLNGNDWFHLACHKLVHIRSIIHPKYIHSWNHFLWLLCLCYSANTNLRSPLCHEMVTILVSSHAVKLVRRDWNLDHSVSNLQCLLIENFQDYVFETQKRRLETRFDLPCYNLLFQLSAVRTRTFWMDNFVCWNWIHSCPF